jgi:diguanylate cyclase (GGDEF)-like protein
MNSDLVLLIIALTVHGLTTMTWWVGGTLLGLSRRAARHWMLGSIANGVALSLIPLHGLVNIPGHLLMSNTLVVIGLLSVRRGLQNFLKLQRTDTWHAVVGAGVAIFNLGICWPMGWQDAGLGVSATALVILLWRTAKDNHTPLSSEFSPGVAVAHSLLLGAAGVLFVGMACVAALPWANQLWSALSSPLVRACLLFVYMLLSILLTYLAGYMVVIRLVRKLEHLSHHDSLTGLLNRRAFEYLLGRECQRLHRFGEYFSLLILDIDHFKRINDRLGHAAGDAVLAAVAQTLQSHAREVDRVARFGGEEFCVLLPRTAHDGALQAAERLRAAINNITIPWNDDIISVTVSTGLATAAESGESLEDLLHRADLALYQAKSEGRNRVVVAPAFTVAPA